MNAVCTALRCKTPKRRLSDAQADDDGDEEVCVVGHDCQHEQVCNEGLEGEEDASGEVDGEEERRGVRRVMHARSGDFWRRILSPVNQGVVRDLEGQCGRTALKSRSLGPGGLRRHRDDAEEAGEGGEEEKAEARPEGRSG